MRASPIVICGPARSGTTLLVRLLDSHPDLAVLPEETYLYQDLLLRRRLSWLVVHLAEIIDLPQLSGILARRPFRRFAFASRSLLRSRLETWIRAFDSVGTTPAELIDKVIPDAITGDRYWKAFLDLYDGLMPGSLDASRYWVEKTPSNERFTALHEREFAGTCRYVHIIRDPRDIAASWFKRRGDTPEERDRTLVRICYLWSLSVHLCARGLSAYPTRYYAVRYENLIHRPQEVMHGICRFLEIDVNESVLTPTKFGKPVSPNSSYAGTESVSAVISSQTGRFPEVLTQPEVRFMEDLLRHQMAACGYAAGQAAVSDAASGPPLLPAGARRVWQSRTQMARAWKFQREFADASRLKVGDGETIR